MTARVRFDQTVNAAVLVAAGLMLANVLFGLADLLMSTLDGALEVEFGGDE